ncbi:acyl-CoA dehydrogenase [Nocardia nova]|uniref:Acyl-[acyl-carrier-protein] dehydrogenase MbtN n=1 Tax=Nocardia nova TaxID=37330 RepID=A0A2S6AN87_9NOCA|nr:acyl-CoA dehydrogenase family protein [Nocardia nova]PPJ25710.1 acyl-CoA dehydrogenase [Nocardia nova]PPJ36663.1 acyl-CoA dehydrogenase [Nocardia nova]
MSSVTLRSPGLFTDEHAAAREQVRRFLAEKVVPHHAQWESAGQVPRSIWSEAGALGLLCPSVPEQYGGLGADIRYSVIVQEEQTSSYATGPGFVTHSEMVAPYLANFGTDEQKQRWLPGMVNGQSIGAVAMSEPSAGSDLRGIRTTAEPKDDGYVLSGQKVFISNGQLADVIIVAAKTGDSNRLSLFVVEADMPGFTRGRALDKIGLHAQDTSELFFDDVWVPRGNLIGDEGAGLTYLRSGLAKERLIIAVGAQARAEAAFHDTAVYVREREVFGKSLSEMQNTRFSMASIRADLEAGRALVDRLLFLYLDDRLDETTAAMAKVWTTEMEGRTVDMCLQLHGGWGYMREYPIARAFVDARVERIAGGTSEVMKEIIARGIWPQHGA